MTTYRTEISVLSGNELLIRTDADGKEWWIPKDPANSDYQRYLRWLNGEEETQGGLN